MRAEQPLAEEPSPAGAGREAAGAGAGQAAAMTTHDPELPQPRDIALEQETPEQAAELEAQSEPATEQPADPDP